jgi:hypothetical protein
VSIRIKNAENYKVIKSSTTGRDVYILELNLQAEEPALAYSCTWIRYKDGCSTKNYLLKDENMKV